MSVRPLYLPDRGWHPTIIGHAIATEAGKGPPTSCETCGREAYRYLLRMETLKWECDPGCAQN